MLIHQLVTFKLMENTLTFQLLHQKWLLRITLKNTKGRSKSLNRSYKPIKSQTLFKEAFRMLKDLANQCLIVYGEALLVSNHKTYQMLNLFQQIKIISKQIKYQNY